MSLVNNILINARANCAKDRMSSLAFFGDILYTLTDITRARPPQACLEAMRVGQSAARHNFRQPRIVLCVLRIVVKNCLFSVPDNTHAYASHTRRYSLTEKCISINIMRVVKLDEVEHDDVFYISRRIMRIDCSRVKLINRLYAENKSFANA